MTAFRTGLTSKWPWSKSCSPD